VKTDITDKYNFQYEMTKVKKKKKFVMHGDYASIAIFLDKKYLDTGRNTLNVPYFKIGIHLRHNFSRNPSRLSAETWLENTALKPGVQ
jgi:hypothetical protein